MTQDYCLVHPNMLLVTATLHPVRIAQRLHVVGGLLMYHNGRSHLLCLQERHGLQDLQWSVLLVQMRLKSAFSTMALSKIQSLRLLLRNDAPLKVALEKLAR